MRYLLTRRLERAAALLRTTDHSVADICFSVGLQSVGSFTTSFTRTYGASPTAYRAAFPPAAAHALVPACVVRAYGRPQRSTFREDSRSGPRLASLARVQRTAEEDPMIRIATAQLWVHDQDEALAFYTDKLGMEVRADVTLPEMGDFRWLTVGAGRPGRRRDRPDGDPRPPVADAETAEQVRTLMAKGFAGTVFLTTDDCQASYDELRARGVEFTEEPEERPYGIDSGFRDPSGNAFRLTEVREMTTV